MPLTGVVLLAVAAVSCAVCASGANILGIFPDNGRSHHILGERLLKALARRGHNCTMASYYPLGEPFPNYTDVALQDAATEEQRNAEAEALLDENQLLKYIARNDVMREALERTEHTLAHPRLRRLARSGQRFDLIVMDLYLNAALFHYGRLLGAPIVGISSFGNTVLNSHLVGNPLPPSYIPILPVPHNMTFLQRALNAAVPLAAWLLGPHYHRSHRRLIERHFNASPTRPQLLEHFALILSNSHYSFESPRPFVPNVVPVGGFHVERPRGLPEDLQRLMDGAHHHGAIYFSLGSNVRASLLPVPVQRAIMRAFARLPQLVLVKWDAAAVPGRPGNVVVRRWLPQNEILAHPHLRLFVSHGGLLSTIEALYFGVPVLGMPFYGDQKTNVPRAVSAGYARQLDWRDISEASFLAELEEMLHNPEYARNARERSALLHDQPLPPMETAVFWVEHVLRHKGAPHLRNTGIYLNTLQYFLVDVIAAAAVIISSVILLSVWMFMKIYKMCFNGKCVKTKTQ